MSLWILICAPECSHYISVSYFHKASNVSYNFVILPLLYLYVGCCETRLPGTTETKQVFETISNSLFRIIVRTYLWQFLNIMSAGCLIDGE